MDIIKDIPEFLLPLRLICFAIQWDCCNFASGLKRLYVMELPKDPMMLFSVINMKLRDCYSSLDELCEDMDVNKDELVNQLKAVGFEYSVEHNKFW